MLIGIVGKANSGKSTFFKALTLAEVLIANYPFATIKPNTGIAHVRIDCVDKDFNVQCNPRTGYCISHQRFVPIEIMDVAGLVPGAHEGLGMGNQFLNDLNQAHALIHVVDASGGTNEKGEPVEPGTNDPCNDVRFLEVELDMWYYQILKKGWEKFARTVNQEKLQIKKALAKQLSAMRVTEEITNTAIKRFSLPDDPMKWSEDELKRLASELRKSTKPMIIAANKIDVGVAEKNLEILKKTFPEYTIIGCSAESELALKEATKKGLIKYVPGDLSFEVIDKNGLSDKQKGALEFIKKHILEKYGDTGVQQVINTAVFKLLRHIAVFPVGVNKLTDSEGRVLPDCFLVPEGSTALDFAYRLHTDFGDKFIRAIDVKKKLTVGKEHKLKHRDIIELVVGK